MNRFPPLCLLAIAFAIACDAPDAHHDTNPRTPIAKADLFGSCEGSDCGGPSTDGNCYCDDQCAAVGDCCSDKVALCDAECGAFTIEFQARIDSGSGFSEILVEAEDAGEDGANVPLGEVRFLTNQFRDYRVEVPSSLALKDGLIARFRGNRARIQNPRFTRNGSIVYHAVNGAATLSSSRYYWAPVPGDCGTAPALQPQSSTVVSVANQRTFRIDTPELRHAFVWARVTDEQCANANVGRARVVWLEDDEPGTVKRLDEVTRTSVLQDVRFTTQPGRKGTLWLTSSRGTQQDPNLSDGHCNVELYLEYR